MDIRWIAALTAALAGACASPRAAGADDIFEIRPLLHPSGACHVDLGDSLFVLPAEEAALLEALRSRAARARNAAVLGDVDVPYKCFGYAVFLAQRAGFERVGFITEPPPAPGLPER